MARVRRNNKPLISDINVVPYIDVMLVLLVIFMITAPLLTQGINVNLPTVASKVMASQQKEPIIVSVDEAGRYYLNIHRNPDAAIGADVLMQEVSVQLNADKKEKSNRQVLIKGDEAVGYGRVVAGMALLQKAGAEHIGLITQPGVMDGTHATNKR